MKTIGLTVLILLTVVSSAWSRGQGDIYNNSFKNGKSLSFNNKVVCNNRDRRSAERCLPKQELAWQQQEIARWKSAIRKAADMLPPEFFEEVGPVSWRFFINRDTWTTAYAGYPIGINLLSDYENLPEWMTWEPFRKNGLSEVEMIFVALHEMAHNYSYGLDEFYVLDEERIEYQTWAKWSWDKKTKQFILSSGTEKISMMVAKEGEVTLYGKTMGRIEDFAETFALCVMWPEYIKDNFPIHYDVIKNILVIEYESVYPIPASIKSKLAVQ